MQSISFTAMYVTYGLVKMFKKPEHKDYHALDNFFNTS